MPFFPAWRDIAEGFLKSWNFPHTCGAIDGKHIAVRAPPNAGSVYFNYKKFHSIVLLAVVDSNYKFIWATIGAPGSNSDTEVWNETDFKKLLERGELGFPEPEPLPQDNEDMPYYLVGDDIFGLRSWLMKPYSSRGLTNDERILNYRLSRARRVSENAFGLLVHRFRVLLNTAYHRPKTVKLITKTCVVLHNLWRTRYPKSHIALVDQPETEDSNFVPGAWRRGRNLDDTIHVVAANRDLRVGKRQRNLLKHWVNSEVGRVPWQNRMI